MRSIYTILLSWTLLDSVLASDSAFTPPPSDRIAALLDFNSPVSLSVRVYSKEELARKPEDGVPLVGYSYSDAESTSVTIMIGVFPVGEFQTEKRVGLEKWITEHATPSRDGIPAIGAFLASDARSILQFPMGFGPGGSTEAALLTCLDSRYEIVLIQQTNSHDDEDPKTYYHHAVPQKELREIIEAIEVIIFKLRMSPINFSGR